MKRHSILVLMIAGAFLAASTGLVVAGGAGHASGMSGKEEMSGSSSWPEETPGSSGDWSWYTEGPVETGSVASPPPAGETFSGESSSPDESLTIREFGGLDFREGIDTH